MEENRLSYRISIEKLPDSLKVITFKTTGLFAKEHSATTIDASNLGMCFKTSEVSPNEIPLGINLKIKFSNTTKNVKAKVVYAAKTADGEFKFGVSFITNSSIEQYNNLLQGSI